MTQGDIVSSSAASAAPLPVESAGATAKAPKSREYLTVAGWGLIAYGIYNILIILFSGAGGPEVPLQRMSQLVALFPVLFVGPALVHASEPSARQSKRLHHQLLRWLVMVICISYLAFIPVSIYSLHNNQRASENGLARLESSLQKRRTELLSAMDRAASPEQIRVALSQFPEVSSVSIGPGDNLQQTREGIRNGINQWVRGQLEQARKQKTSADQYLSALIRTVVLGCLVCGLAQLSLAMRMLPWLQTLSKSTWQAATSSGETLASAPRRLLRPIFRRQARPAHGVHVQNNRQQFRRLLRRLPNPLVQLRNSKRQLQRSLQSMAKSTRRLFKRPTPSSKRRRSSSRRSSKRR